MECSPLHVSVLRVTTFNCLTILCCDSVTSNLNKGSVYVVADGVKTYNVLFKELYGLINFEKLSYTSALRIGNGITVPISWYRNSSYSVNFDSTYVTSTNTITFISFELASDHGYYKTATGTFTVSNLSNDKPISGVRYEIVY